MKEKLISELLQAVCDVQKSIDDLESRKERFEFMLNLLKIS